MTRYLVESATCVDDTLVDSYCVACKQTVREDRVCTANTDLGDAAAVSRAREQCSRRRRAAAVGELVQ